VIHPVYQYRLWRLGTTAKLARLRQAQWDTAAEVEQMQNRRLADLLRHAFDHVPYYRQVLADAAVIDGNRRIDLTGFTSIPFLDKDIIRARPDDLVSDDLDRRPWHRNYSGGSTGEPVAFVQELREEARWSRALTLLFDEWSGRRPGDRWALLWGSERDLTSNPSLRVRFRRHTRRLLALNAFGMTPQHMQEYVEAINRFKPRQILAYAGSLYHLARFIDDEGLRIHSPAGIMTSAESIYPEQRALIERVFRAPVFDRYGSREAGNMACECDHHAGLHVASPTHLLEILRPDGKLAGPGESGEIVVTCFETFAMPLIRYRIGDRATWADEPCKCGRAWPLLKQVDGRVMDAFVLPDGGTVDGCYFTMGFFGRDWVEKFQVVQETADVLRVYIVLRDPSLPREAIQRDLEGYDEHVRTVLGRKCDVEYEFVSSITPSPQGKHRYTISRLYEQEGGSHRQKAIDQ
jgi:phenylacetate-CoA ligase